MAQNQKSYDHEFKAQAVKPAQEIGGHKAANELGTPKGTTQKGRIYIPHECGMCGLADGVFRLSAQKERRGSISAVCTCYPKERIHFSANLFCSSVLGNSTIFAYS